MKAKISKIRRSLPLADQAYLKIKQMIMSNRLRPGQVLKEAALARDLGISRSPLREALARLQNEKFIENEPGKGTKVSPLTPKYLSDVYELRSALECVAARKAAHLIPEEKLKETERLLENLRVSLNEGETATFGKYDFPFHDLYIERCNNDFLIEEVHKLHDHLARIRNFADTLPVHTKTSHKEHLEILKAMRTKNPDKLERAVRTHIENVRKRLVSALQEKQKIENTADATG